MAFSRGKRAIAICDRCGQQYLLRQLRYQPINGKITRIKVCQECWDLDSPLLQLGKIKTFDPQGLDQPRPDPSLYMSRSGAAWNPVGGVGCTITCYPQVIVPTDVSFNFPFVGGPNGST